MYTRVCVCICVCAGVCISEMNHSKDTRNKREKLGIVCY